MSRELSWLALVQQADPDHARTSRYTIEYEFTAPGRGDERTHEGGRRVFYGNYDVRGPYRAETISDGGLVWRGMSLVWRGDALTWGE